MKYNYQMNMHSCHQLVSASRSIIDTAWWQVMLALIVAFLTALCAHYFYQRRRYRDTVLSAAAQLISATRQLRRNCMGFSEYETAFNHHNMAYYEAARPEEDTYPYYNRRTVVVSGALDKERRAELSRAAADGAKIQSEVYQKEILQTQNEVDKAYFILIGISRKAREDKSLKKAVEALLGFRLVTIAMDMKQAAKDIDEVFKPNLATIQRQCERLMQDNSKSL